MHLRWCSRRLLTFDARVHLLFKLTNSVAGYLQLVTPTERLLKCRVSTILLVAKPTDLGSSVV